MSCSAVQLALVAVLISQAPAAKPPLATHFGRTIDADGRRIVVGSFLGDSEDGRIDVFVAAGKSWRHAGPFNPPGPTIDNLGKVFRLAGDELIIGDPRRATGLGGIHIFPITPQGRLGKGSAQSLFASDAQLYCQFGSVLAPGADMLIVGTPLAYFPDVASGAAYVFRKQGRKWVEHQKLTTGDDSDDTIWLGAAVAFDERLLAIGAPLADTPPRDYRGAVYLFVPGADGSFKPATPERLSLVDDPSESALGSRIAMNRHWLFASATDAAVGASVKQGVVYGWRRDEQGRVGPEPELRLVDQDGAADDRFGTSLQANDSLLCIGTGGREVEGVANAGIVYLYRISDDGSLSDVPSQQLQAPTLTKNGGFGNDVVMTDGRILVGAAGEQKFAGAVYIFEPRDGKHLATFRLSPIDGVRSLEPRRSR